MSKNEKKNYLFTKKGKKQFNKLSSKDKAVIAGVAISDTVNKVMRTKITEAMISGMLFQKESLYQKHVIEIDKMDLNSEERSRCVDELLSDIRLGHIDYLQSMGNEGGENED